MPIIFNTAAFLQVLVLALVLGFLYLINLEGLFVHLGIHDAVGMSFLSYLSFFIIAPMHRRGIQGHVFFLPTWFIALTAPLFFAWMERQTAVFWITALISVVLWLRFALKNGAFFIAEYAKANAALQQLKYMKAITDDESKTYWIVASHVFFRPSFLFLYANGLRKLVFRNSVTMEQFVQHYREFIPALKNTVEHKAQFEQLTEIDASFNRPNYDHTPGTLDKIAAIITAHNNRYKQ
jgi:hypothetical protein